MDILKLFYNKIYGKQLDLLSSINYEFSNQINFIVIQFLNEKDNYHNLRVRIMYYLVLSIKLGNAKFNFREIHL